MWSIYFHAEIKIVLILGTCGIILYILNKSPAQAHGEKPKLIHGKFDWTDRLEVTSSNITDTYDQQLSFIKNRHLYVATDSHGNYLKPIFEKLLPSWDIKVDNYSGSATRDLLKRIKLYDKDFFDAQKVVILHIGTNDFGWAHWTYSDRETKHRTLQNRSDEQIISDITELLKFVSAHFVNAVKIYSLNLPREDLPFQKFEKRRKTVNKAVVSNASQSMDVKFVNQDSSFLSPNGLPVRHLFRFDKLHLNEEGRHILVENLVKKMCHYLIETP